MHVAQFETQMGQVSEVWSRKVPDAVHVTKQRVPIMVLPEGQVVQSVRVGPEQVAHVEAHDPHPAARAAEKYCAEVHWTHWPALVFSLGEMQAVQTVAEVQAEQVAGQD